MNNLAKDYKKALEETLATKSTLKKEYEYSSKIYSFLKTYYETPDIDIIEFLNASFEDWIKVLPQNLTMLIINFSISPSESLVSEIQKLILDRKQEILYEVRKIDIDLVDCSYEVDAEIEKGNTKIGELLKQIASLSKRIGELEAINNEWRAISDML